MSGLRELIREIHRRSLWQVLGIYLGSGWFVLQVADHLVNKFGLPPWVYGLAFLLVLLGLPIVLATAFVQEGVPGQETDGEGSGRAARSVAARPGEDPGAVRRLFTWRHAMLGGLVAFAMWGVLAAGWLLLLRRDPDALPWPRDGAASTAERRPEPGFSALREPEETGARADTGREPAAGGPATAADSAVPSRPSGTPERPTALPEKRFDTAGGRLADASPPPAQPAESGGRFGAPEGYREYESARGRADASREAAREVSADSLGVEGFRSGDSTRMAALEDAAAGRFGKAALAMERARARYDEARQAAVVVLKARADSARRPPAARDSTPEGAAASDSASPAATGTGGFDARATIDGLLGRLADAFAAEDLAAVRRIWVSLTPEEADNFRHFFQDRRDIRVRFRVDSGSVAPSADGVSFSVHTSWEYFDERQGRQVTQPPFEQRFRARRSEGGWTLSSS